MKRTLRLLCLLAAICTARPATAQESGILRCAAGQERVWLYDSLASLGIEAKLKCGDPVQILGRDKGFVKVRVQDGTEGYVPEASLPKPVSANETAAKAPEQMTIAEQARAARAARAGRNAAAAGAESAESKTVAAVPVRPQPVAAPARLAPEPQPAGSLQPAVASTDSASANSRTVIAVSGSPKPPDANPGVSQPAAPAPTASHSTGKEKPAPGHSKVLQPKTQPQPQPQPPAKPAHVAPPSNTSSASNVTPVPSPSPKSKASSSHSGPAGAGTSAPHAVAVASNFNAEPPRTVAAVAKPSDDDPDSEEYPERRIEDESANPSCSLFFSAYGLTPQQYKWLASDRGKKYPSVCPAPSPTMVDYVVILTHDVPFYNSTMPAAVHTDKNGFSDFTPMSMVDTSLLSKSDLDRSKHEYVWVFKTKRGAFDPSKFSPRRRPQFTKLESSSHAGDRTVEDAFRFISEGTPAQ
jgi:Bacterial SH3 domain